VGVTTNFSGARAKATSYQDLEKASQDYHARVKELYTPVRNALVGSTQGGLRLGVQEELEMATRVTAMLAKAGCDTKNCVVPLEAYKDVILSPSSNQAVTKWAAENLGEYSRRVGKRDHYVFPQPNDTEGWTKLFHTTMDQTRKLVTTGNVRSVVASKVMEEHVAWEVARAKPAPAPVANPEPAKGPAMTMEL
jgi:hypothetical protein